MFTINRFNKTAIAQSNIRHFLMNINRLFKKKCAEAILKGLFLDTIPGKGRKPSSQNLCNAHLKEMLSRYADFTSAFNLIKFIAVQNKFDLN